MIVDKVANAKLYGGLSKGLDRALEYVSDPGLRQLPEGRTPLQGDEVYVMAANYETGPSSQKRYEAHHRYIDLQFVLSGKETIYWSPVERLIEDTPYAEQQDCVMYEDAAGVPITLSEGYFCVLFPEDAHKPGCIWGSPARVQKAVVKILI